MEKLKLKVKNIPIYIIILVLSIISSISFSIYNYAKANNEYEIHISKGTKLDTLLVANSPMEIGRLKKDENAYVEDYKLCTDNKDYFVKINTSVVESIYIKFIGNGGRVIFNGQEMQIEDGVYANYIKIIDSIKNCINKMTLIYFVISLIVMTICVWVIANYFDKIKNDTIKWYNIPLALLTLFVVYYSCFYLSYSILKEFVIVPIIALLVYVIYCISKSKEKKFENIYAAIVVFVGIALIFLVPPCNVPDEASHFARAYRDSLLVTPEDDGYFNFPEAIDNLWYKFTNNLHMTENKIYGTAYLSEVFGNNNYELNDSYTNYKNVKYLSFVPYVPTAIIVFIGRNIGAPALLLLLLGRLANFIIASIICYFAIKKVPHFKKLFLVVCLFPIFIQQTAAINMDYLTDSISVLLVAQIIAMIYKKQKIVLKEFVYLGLTCFVLSISKFGYFPLLLLMFLIPNDNFKNKKIAIITKIVFFMFTFVFSFFVSISATTDSMQDTSLYGIKYFFTNPIDSIKIMLNAVFGRVDQDIIRGFIDCFAYSNVWHKGPFYLAIIGMYVLLILVHDDDDKSLDIINRGVYLISALMIIAIVYAIAFSQFTHKGSTSITGLQARYFLPIALPLYIGLSNSKIKIDMPNKKVMYSIMICVTFAISFITLTMAFS